MADGCSALFWADFSHRMIATFVFQWGPLCVPAALPIEAKQLDSEAITAVSGTVLQPEEEEADGYLRARVEESLRPHDRDDAGDDGADAGVKEVVTRTLRLARDGLDLCGTVTGAVQ